MHEELEIDRSETRQLVDSWLSKTEYASDQVPQSEQRPFSARPARLGLGAKFIPHTAANDTGFAHSIQQKLQKQIRSEPQSCSAAEDKAGGDEVEESRSLLSKKRKSFADLQESLISQVDINRELTRLEKRRLKKQKRRQNKSLRAASTDAQ